MKMRDDAIKALDRWLNDEFGHGICEEGADIEFCYSQYRGEITVDEQWVANVDELRIWLELEGEDFTWPEAKVYEFMDYDEMVEFIEGMTFDGLISEADDFIETHEEV